jgi:hypothetical protein
MIQPRLVSVTAIFRLEALFGMMGSLMDSALGKIDAVRIVTIEL